MNTDMLYTYIYKQVEVSVAHAYMEMVISQSCCVCGIGEDFLDAVFVQNKASIFVLQ